jgi:hypothetical protein
MQTTQLFIHKLLNGTNFFSTSTHIFRRSFNQNTWARDDMIKEFPCLQHHPCIGLRREVGVSRWRPGNSEGGEFSARLFKQIRSLKSLKPELISVTSNKKKQLFGFEEERQSFSRVAY